MTGFNGFLSEACTTRQKYGATAGPTSVLWWVSVLFVVLPACIPGRGIFFAVATADAAGDVLASFSASMFSTAACRHAKSANTVNHSL